jgi:predicted SprT family Zn-dependent metalloprotease
MFITKDFICKLYEGFVSSPTFKNYAKYPASSKVKFTIKNTPEAYGEYKPEEKEFNSKHEIMISTGRCTFLDTVCKTMLHELIHMGIYINEPNSKKYLSHNGEFKRMQNKIAKEFGFDPKEL